MDAPKPGLPATLIASALAFAGFVAAAGLCTRGFDVWTFEDMRRQDAAQGRISAPPTRVRTASGQQLALWTGDRADPAVYLVNFVYTTCPTVCQTLGSEFAQMQSALSVAGGPARRLRLLSLSFDVERDRPAQLADYARRHRADPALWTVAAPVTSDEAQRLLRRLGVIAIADGSGGFVHNGAIQIIDARGIVRAIYDDARWPEALREATRLAASPP